MSETWRLSHATAALYGGIRNLREQDADLNINIAADLPNETMDVEAALLAVARMVVQAERLEEMSNNILKDQQDRKKRFGNRADRGRGILLAAMDALGYLRLEHPDLTISLGRGKAAGVITDETKLTDDYIRTRKEPDKTKIAEALQDGVVVEGAVLSNTLPTVTIRTR